jgi:hypothetical protein
MSSVLPANGVFPVSAGSPESAVEPSNMVVASDVVSDSSSVAIYNDVRPAAESDPFAAPGVPKRGRLAAIAGACAGVLALVGATAFVLSGGVRSHATNAVVSPMTEANVAPATTAAAVPPPAETLEIDAIPAPPPPTAIAEAVAPVAKAEPTAAKVPTEPKKRFGKLTIKSEARHKNVWFDGKRMLGSGQRSFLVFCGMHTVAVADKADAKDIEVPCNGEYIVSR